MALSTRRVSDDTKSQENCSCFAASAITYNSVNDSLDILYTEPSVQSMKLSRIVNTHGPHGLTQYISAIQCKLSKLSKPRTRAIT